LRIGTAADNYADARARGRNSVGDRHGMRGGARAVRGEAQGSSKLTADLVRWLRKTRADGQNLSEAARRLGISYSTAKHIISRKAWAHVE
jgi:hypothetical protein